MSISDGIVARDGLYVDGKVLIVTLFVIGVESNMMWLLGKTLN